MKILYIGEGNSYHLQKRLAYILSNCPGNEIYLISENSSGVSGVKEKIIKPILDFPIVRFFEKYFIFKSFIKNIKPDIIHIIGAHPLNLLPVFTGFHPVLISCWGGDVLREQGARGNIFYEAIFNRAIAESDAVICVSQNLKNEVDRVAPGKTTVLSFGVDTTVFYKRSNIADLRIKYGFSQKDKIIFSPRGLGKVYNIENILKAFSLIKNNMENVRLVLNATSRNENEERVLENIRSLADRLGIASDIVYKSRITDCEMAEFFSISDMVVSFALSDGMPVSILEAMACEAPVICSDIPSLHEIMEENINTYFVPKDSPELLADKIIKLINDKDKKEFFIKNNVDMITRRFKLQNEIDQLLRTYKSLLGKI